MVTPLKLLELFFDDVLVDMIVDYTKLYNHREKIDIGFEITKEQTHLSSAYYCLVGAISFQIVRCVSKVLFIT